MNAKDESVVAVLEKVASLDDKEEVIRLAEEAEGRKFVVNSAFNLLRCAMVYKRLTRKMNVPNPPFCSEHAVFFGNFGEIRGVVKIVEAIKAAFREETTPDIQSRDDKTKLLQQIGNNHETGES